jgi:hypothetical protein
LKTFIKKETKVNKILKRLYKPKFLKFLIVLVFNDFIAKVYNLQYLKLKQVVIIILFLLFNFARYSL